MRLLAIFGTRPEAIKMAPVVRALNKARDMECIVCVTGQHRHMLDEVMRVFDLSADIDLRLMQADQSLDELTARVVTGVGQAMERVKPDYALVHGDTTTAFAGALASYYAGVPVAHVEAGLRSKDKRAPWPEEMNRRLVGTLADLHFAPTLQAERNLLAENVPADRIFVTGNTVVDALLWAKEGINGDPALRRRLDAEYGALFGRRTILVTGHRRESFGRGLENLCDALTALARQHDDISLIYPVHLNPNVRGPVTARLSDLANVHLIPPVDYLSFVYLLDRADLIVTDSGGVQEEAASIGKPVVVTRDRTERPEALLSPRIRLAGTDRDRLIDAIGDLLDGPDDRNGAAPADPLMPFGKGDAAQRIYSVLAGLVESSQALAG